MQQRIPQIHSPFRLGCKKFSENYRLLKKLINKALAGGYALEDLHLIPQNGGAVRRNEFTREDLLEILHLLRRIKTRYRRLLKAPVPRELVRDILSKPPESRLPWEQEALDKIEEWRKDVSAVRDEVRKELNDHLNSLFYAATKDDQIPPLNRRETEPGTVIPIDVKAKLGLSEESKETKAHRKIHAKSSAVTSFHVFISCASEDKNIAELLEQELTSASLGASFVNVSLKPGAPWNQQMRKAIENSNMCVVLLSSAGLSCRSRVSLEWPVIQEVAWRRKDFTIFPIMLEEVEIPPFLRAWPSMRLNPNRLNVGAAMKRIHAIANGAIPAPRPTPLHTDRTQRAERFSWIWEVLSEKARRTKSDADQTSHEQSDLSK